MKLSSVKEITVTVKQMLQVTMPGDRLSPEARLSPREEAILEVCTSVYLAILEKLVADLKKEIKDEL